jgi:ATP-dependent Lon protease
MAARYNLVCSTDSRDSVARSQKYSAADAAARYWLQTVLDDRSESAPPPADAAQKDKSMSDVDARIRWLAGLICRPQWKPAASMASYLTKRVAGFDALTELQAAGIVSVDEHRRIVAGFANRVDDPVLRVAWQILNLRTSDPGMMIHDTVAGAIGLLCSAKGDTGEARARLRVWDDVARGKYDPAAYSGGFFEIAEKYWRGEMRFINAAGPGAPMRDRFQHPALQTLMFSRWDDALGWLHGASVDVAQRFRLDDVMSCSADRVAVAAVISDIVEDLYHVGTPDAGAWALAWSTLTADPRKPASFYFLPQLQFAIDHADIEDDADVRARIRIWWRAAEGEWSKSTVSIFRIADVETRTDAEFPGIDAENVEDLPDPGVPPGSRTSTSATLFADIGLPTLIVMPSGKATKLNNFHLQYKDLVDAALPLVVVRDVARIRAELHAEFPHATVAVDLLLRDMREGRPVTLKPVLLVGSPGCGKSRMVRRLADILRAYVYRYDAASSSDSHFGGTSKAWSNTEPSVPARAIQQSRTANPIVMIDEIDKASTSTHHGRLVDSLLPFCDRETAVRYRDQSLDAELDLSRITYIATANDASKLPTPLRDRFRTVKVPTPTLQHLPQLAGQVMRDLAAEDEARHGDAPLAADELVVICRAWERSKFSMRALQKIVAATLEARDSYAPRH